MGVGHGGGRGTTRPLQRAVAARWRHQLAELLARAHAPDREFALARAGDGFVVVKDGGAVYVRLQGEDLGVDLRREGWWLRGRFYILAL